MRYKVLAIFDTENVYADLLTKQLLRIKNHGLKIHNFSSKEQLLKFAGQEIIHYLVISDEYERFEKELQSVAEVVYWFTTDKNKLWNMTERKYLYKYQSAQDIYSLICNKKDREEEEETVLQLHKKETKLIGVYSPVHRNGQTIFAKAIASSYSGEHTKALYVNFEEYSGTEVKEEGNLADMLYYIRQDLSGTELQNKLKALIKVSEDYDYILPIPVSQELKNVELEEWKNLLGILKNSGIYEAIVLDLDSCIQGFFDLLHLCHFIYSPVRKCNNDEHKQQQFNRNLELLYKKEFQHKITVLDIPECEVSDGEEVLDYMKRYALCLAKDGES